MFILVATSYGIRMGAHGHHPGSARTATNLHRCREGSAAAMVTSLMPMFQPRSPRTPDSPSDSDPRVRYIHPSAATDYRCAKSPIASCKSACHALHFIHSFPVNTLSRDEDTWYMTDLEPILACLFSAIFSQCRATTTDNQLFQCSQASQTFW